MRRARAPKGLRSRFREPFWFQSGTCLTVWGGSFRELFGVHFEVGTVSLTSKATVDKNITNSGLEQTATTAFK